VTTEQIIALVRQRGLAFTLKDGRPLLVGPKAEATPALMHALKWHREDIVAHLLATAPREWLWRDGHRYTESPDDGGTFGRADWHPVGAWWWRKQGETAWEAVPGSPGEMTDAPALAG
jgi:hypothetical protein